MGFLSRHDDAIDYCVERRAITALDPQKVPGSCIIRLFTVIARNIHHTSQLRRNLLQRHSRSHCIPGGHHALTCFSGFLTNGAPRIMGSKLPEAFPVNGMAARHFMRCTPRTKEELLADRTVGLVFATLAVVVRVQAFVDAHATIVAMLEVLRPTDTAKSTILAMVGFFIVCHP
jgi:hypothetical protein